MPKAVSYNGILVRQETQRLKEKGEEARQAVIPVILLVLMLTVIFVLSRTQIPWFVILRWLGDIVLALIWAVPFCLVFWAGWKLSNPLSIHKEEFLGRKKAGQALTILSLVIALAWLVFFFAPLIPETFRMLVQL